MTKETILVVDDDITLTKTLQSLLSDADYQVLTAHTAEDGLSLARTEAPQLIILDVMVPTMGGWQACKQLRTFTNVPIIFLTALGNVENVVRGLQMGADDYLVKPFEPTEILARVMAHLRRMQTAVSPPEPQPTLIFGDNDIELNLAARRVYVRGDEVELTPREYDLLLVLAQNAGRVVTTADLAKKAWGMHDEAAPENIKPYIHYLRKKIEADSAAPRWILTVRGVGYRFAEQ